MTVMGVDPGAANTGVAVVRGAGLELETYSFGTITTSPSLSTSARLLTIFDAITGILAEKSPDLMVVEDIFSLGKYPKSGILLGKVAGVILLAGGRYGVPVQEVPVREAKKVLTGNGNASKDQLEKAVRDRLGRTEPITPSHASDALALALIGLYRRGCH